MGSSISVCLYQPPKPTPIQSNNFFWIVSPLVGNGNVAGGEDQPYDENSCDCLTINYDASDDEDMRSPLSSGKNREDYVNKIPATFISYPGATLTILYSHGNAEDLGMIYDTLVELSRMLRCNVAAYDYTGYGLSRKLIKLYKKQISGDRIDLTYDHCPNEQQCYADIQAVYSHLIHDRNINPKDIILYGRSLGGGPSCFLAQKTWEIQRRSEKQQRKREKSMRRNSRKNTQVVISPRSGEGVGGLVLHSCFTSVLRVVVDLGFTMVGDMFPNIDRVSSIGSCPVNIIHGTEDEIVPFSHGKALYDALPSECKVIPPFWAKGAKHNDIDQTMLLQYVLNLSDFIKYIQQNQSSKTGERNESTNFSEYVSTTSVPTKNVRDTKSNRSNTLGEPYNFARGRSILK